VTDLAAGPVDDSTCTIRLDLADFLRMSTCETNGAMLAMSGKLEVAGDLIASMDLADWFVLPEAAIQ
jgi:putative sterol carrier protein